MKPKLNYRSRPKKSGAKKRQRVKAQKRRLMALGVDEEKLRHMTTVEIRDMLKAKSKKKAPKAAKKKPVKKKVAPKKKKAPAKTKSKK